MTNHITTDTRVKQFIAQTLSDLTNNGYRCIPAKDGKPLGGFKEGQLYPSSHELWQQANMIAINQRETIVIDLDGYKEGAADAATIAAYLGLTPEQLEAARVQAAPERQSYHWMFRLPEGASDTITGNCGIWAKHVDLRVGNSNQLVFVKHGKQITFPPVAELPMLDLSRMLVPFTKRAATPVSNGPVTLSDSTSTKGAALLREMCDKLAQQQEGGRNAALNDTALIIGHYVGGGEIAKSDAEQALTEAALAIGLSQGETAATIRSGLERGIKEPKRCAMTPQEVFASGLATPTPRPVPPPVQSATTAEDAIIMRDGFQFLSNNNLAEHFKGCVYVASQHRVLTPSGDLMKPEVFNASYGGYVFSIDASNDKTTRKAFEALTESQVYHFPRVKALAFRPDMEPRAIFTEAGTDYVNCYTPCHGERVAGDVSLFLDHMQRLIPHDGDREILMSWIASCIQNVGKKHQWSPVLVGTEGNGKSLIGKIVRYALGSRWVSEPRPNQMGGQFNGWVENRLFAIVEEIHMGGRREMLETLKPLITNSVVQVEKKGVDSYDADNRCNILMCTNHKDAVIKTKDDRRYSIIFTGQQSKEDKQRDGMDDAYFTRLWDWLENGGFAACADYFDKYQVKVNVMGNAPDTSSTEEAIAMTLGGVEQEIMEAVEMERFGFTHGMIRTDCASALLKDAGYKVTKVKLAQIIKSLGYEKHPVEGVKFREGKSRVYVKKGHLSAQLSHADILSRLGVPAVRADNLPDAAVIFTPHQ